MRPEEAAAVFAELRPYLHGVAYRLTSSWADAEDVVADAWPRWSECRAADVHRRHQHHQVGQAVGQDAAPAQASRLLSAQGMSTPGWWLIASTVSGSCPYRRRPHASAARTHHGGACSR
jgi:Sigma-70 region 2